MTDLNKARPVKKGRAQPVEKPLRVAIAARLIALRAVRSLALCIMKYDFGASPQAPAGISSLHPDQGYAPWTHLFRQPAHPCADPQLVEKPFRVTIAARLIALRAVRSLALCIMKYDIRALPQAPAGISYLHPDQGYAPWTHLLRQPAHPCADALRG